MLPFGGNRDQTCENCWKDLPFGYKSLFIFTLGYNVLSMFLSFLFTTFVFEGYRVAHEIQLWRIIMPFFAAGNMPFAIFSILINFLWLLSIYPPLEKKYSTSYVLVQTFLQNFLVNLVLFVISIVLYDIFSIDPSNFLIINFGLFPICMIFIWYQASQNPDQHTTFCCMPCLIPMKWIPVLILVISAFMASTMLYALIVASAVGYLQFMHLKRRLIKLPLKFYRRFDTLLPKSITGRPDYVRVQNVQADLQSQCSMSGANVQGGSNPFNRNHNVIQEPFGGPSKVQVFGKGVSIGGGNAQNFRGVWAQKAEQIEIEPVPFHQISQKKPHQQQIDPQFFQSNDSNLHMNTGNEEQSEDGLEEKDEKKVAKQHFLL